MTSPHDPFAAPGRQSSGAYGPPPAPSGPGPAPSETRTETKAVLAIVLAVLAWTPTVPFLGAIAALLLARSARRDIEASGGRLTGAGLCTWATVLSWVHLVVVVGLVLLAVVAFGLFAVAVPFVG